MTNLNFIFQQFESALNCELPENKDPHCPDDIVRMVQSCGRVKRLTPFEKLELQLLLLSVLAIEAEAKEYNISLDIPTDIDYSTTVGNIFGDIMDKAKSVEQIAACLKLITLAKEET